MAGYVGPNGRRYEKRRWIGIVLISAAMAAVLNWLGLRCAQK
jgi:hypothetical protein